MRIYPNSYGGSHGATVRRVRECNPCHDPKSGLFDLKGQGNCSDDCGEGSRGEWEDPGRQRAIYGQQKPLKGDELALTEAETHKAEEFLSANTVEDFEDEDDVAKAQKDHIARVLGADLEAAPGFDAFYTKFSTEIESYASGLGKTQTVEGAPDPADVKEDYESYIEEEREEQDNAFYRADEGEYNRQRDKARDAVRSTRNELAAIYEEVQEERATGSYGDVSTHPNLPGMEDVQRGRGGPALNPEVFLQGLLVEQGLITPGGRWASEPKTLDHGAHQKWDGAAWEDKLYELSWDDPEFRATVKDAMAEFGDVAGTGDFPTEKDFANNFLGVNSKYFNPDDLDEGFQNWRENEAGEPDYQYKSFDQWYEDKYGIDPSEWQTVVDTDYGQGEKAAAWLINRWADTSGDGSVSSVMLQETAASLFKLGATYAGVYTDRAGEMLDAPEQFRNQVREAVRTHGGVLSAFLTKMYDHTQERLAAAGITHVTLYRGTSFRTTREKGLSSVNPNGDFIDALMQPMSSFSSDFRVANSFGGDGDASYMIGMRVPARQIIGTCVTGFGCLNEHEFVVLGGRHPSFIVQKHALKNPRLRSGFEGYTTVPDKLIAFWDRFTKSKPRLNPRTSGGVVIGQGDRV